MGTPELMTTERSCMKEAGRSSEQNLLMPSGKRSLRNSPRDHQRNFLSGSVRGPARRLVMLRPQRARRMVVRKHQQRRIMMKKKKKRKKKSKYCLLKTSDLLIKCADAHEFCSTFLSDLNFWYRSNDLYGNNIFQQ